MKKMLVTLTLAISAFAADPELLSWSVDTASFQVPSKISRPDTVRNSSNQIVSIDTISTITWLGSVTFSCRDTDGDSMGVFIDVALGTDTITVDSIWGVKTAVTGNNLKAYFRFHSVHRNWTGSIPARVRLSLDDRLLGYKRKPVIVTQPASVTINAGQAATFTVAAVADPALMTYQWKKNGTNIESATSASYHIAAAQVADSGSYTVFVANTIGNVTSSVAVLTVNFAPSITTQPVSQTITQGSPVTFTVAATGKPAPTYQWKKDGANISDATSASFFITSVQPADAASYTVTVSNSVSSVTSNAAVLTVNNGPAITTQPVSQTITAGSPVTFTVAASGNPAPTYQWKKDGNNISGATSATLTIASVQPADAGSYTAVAANGIGSSTSNAAVLTVNYAPSITTQPVSQTINAGSPVTFTVAATGNPAPTYQWKKGGTNITGATSASLSITSTVSGDAGSYTVVVTNSVNTVTSNAAVLTVNYAPSITTQPESKTVDSGAAVTFTVVASGVPAPTYQWKKDGTNIEGATSASYTITSTVPADAGSYTVAVTNSVTTVTSNPAVLTVNYAPRITTQPVSQSVRIGRSATFTVAAAGVPAPTYQWKKDGADIPGATGAGYTIACAWVVDTGAYTVDVMNILDTVTSTAVTFTLDTTSWFTTDNLIAIPAGDFFMGDSFEVDTVHKVTVSAFKISNTHVTQGEYEAVMGLNPSEHTGDPHLPVQYVTWFDAVLYCNAKSKLMNKDTIYSYTSITGTPGNGCSDLGGLAVNFTKTGYRLPTEAEYEYACRAGTTSDYYWGMEYPPLTTADTLVIDSHAVWNHNSNGHPWPVGSKIANPWQLYDMVGLVQHWINDWYESPFLSTDQTDPTGPETGTVRVDRGGSFSPYSQVTKMQTFHRDGGYEPDDRSGTLGFRVVLANDNGE
ncbi:MAG: immunoglobulin domain-containing protein [Chitinispirillaceae bacterium]|nr:immunoglobulin domain-containing protein [Chitinispirillaceae bacterium]